MRLGLDRNSSYAIVHKEGELSMRKFIFEISTIIIGLALIYGASAIFNWTGGSLFSALVGASATLPCVMIGGKIHDFFYRGQEIERLRQKIKKHEKTL